MANTKSAQKKARKDIRITAANSIYLAKIDSIVNFARKVGYSENVEGLKTAYSTIDKAAKRAIISPQRAARLKSKISRVA